MTRSRAKRRDANEPQIVEAIHAFAQERGLGVSITYNDGKGEPDLLVGIAGRNILVEVKNPGTRGKLTDDQEDWHRDWHGQAAIVYTKGDVLRLLDLETKRAGY